MNKNADRHEIFFKGAIKKALAMAYTINTPVVEWRYKPGSSGASKTSSGPKGADRLISTIIPMVGEGDLNRRYFPSLQEMLRTYLPRQDHKKYEVLVYCDGPNDTVRQYIDGLGDKRIKYFALERQAGRWGNPQTREGIKAATGDFFVRMNCDNRPYSDYFSALLGGFYQAPDVGVTYGRVVFKGVARREHEGAFTKPDNELWAFMLPKDRSGALRLMNIDCMNYMTRMDLAKRFVNEWDDTRDADWMFLEGLLKNETKTKFIDRLIGEKR